MNEIIKFKWGWQMESPTNAYKDYTSRACVSKQNSRQVRMWVKREMFAEQKGLCAYCAKPMLCSHINTRHPRYFTVDHILPVSAGGTWAVDNLLLVCLSCNRLKADRIDFTCDEVRNG